MRWFANQTNKDKFVQVTMENGDSIRNSAMQNENFLKTFFKISRFNLNDVIILDQPNCIASTQKWNMC